MPDHGPQRWVGDWSGRRAQLSPDRVGLVDATTGAEYTYADLDRRANRCAHMLDARGVHAIPDADAGGRVVVVSRNRPEYVDLFFATGKTGGVLAPLSHRLAPRELATLLGDVDPSLVVVEEPFADDVGAALAESDGVGNPSMLSLPVDGAATWERYDAAISAVTEVDSDGEKRGVDSGDGANAPSGYDGPDVAMTDPHLLLHTGGSTGTPKESILTHEAVVWNSTNTITAWDLRPDDVTPMTFPMFHTGGWNVLTVPLFHVGGTVVISREVDPGDVLRTVDERGVTVFVAVPAVLRSMVDHDEWADTDLSTLRFAKSGGGPCREAVIDAWLDRGVDLSQGYGLTECGPNNFAMPDDWPREKADTVGVPAMHVDARIVDEEGNERRTGEIGELELRSPHVAAGYWRNAEATAETFGAWVSTGDLARIDEDGYVSIEGRKKNMFVSGGENVYPAEVEDAVASHPSVDEVVVVPVEDDRWGQVGKAVVEGDDSFTLDELTAFLDDRLARFKRPRHLAFVPEMPTSGPSKIDREAVAAEFGD